MRFILKDLNNEPRILLNYRKETPNASFSGFQDSEPEVQKTRPLKESLCKEQGYICCYCMRRILPETTTIEHYITQKKHEKSTFTKEVHKAHELDFMNMLGSCNIKTRNCSGIRGNTPLSTDPRIVQIEQQVQYLKNGVIYSDIPIIQNDFELLQLGTIAKPLPINDAHWLVKNRAELILAIQQRLAKKGWTKSNIETEIKYWNTPNKEGYLQEFCQVAIFYLRKKLKFYVN
jgi:hypothetical protein